jgi:hypothetical protein
VRRFADADVAEHETAGLDRRDERRDPRDVRLKRRRQQVVHQV